MNTKFALSMVCACALSQAPSGLASARPGVVIPQQSRNSISQRGNVWVWNQEENGNSLELTVRGEVEFNDAYTEVRRVSSGGSLEIRERRLGESVKGRRESSSDYRNATVQGRRARCSSL